MKNILKLNAISDKVLDVFKDNYQLCDSADDALGIMVRSYNMHEYTPADSILCVGRAGAGTNNIPVKDYAAKGVVVFNTPGANANAVKELVLGALFLASRKICQGINWANGLTDGEKTVGEQVEKGKKAFGGCEILGKTLAVYGLGAIGRKIAQSACALGMNVIGFDPYLPKDAKIEGVTILNDKSDLFKMCDYLTLHVPLTNETRGLINKDTIAIMKDGVKVINASRGEIVNDDDIISATESGKVSCYVTDFPNAKVVGHANILTIPHLGASTEEAEDNCAVMAASQMVDYIENGNIVNSVNYPSIKVDRNGVRTVILCKDSSIDEIKVIAKGNITTAVKNEYGVVILDGEKQDTAKLSAIDGVIKVREI
ncbi:MAG: 3-phosphoglycerate dehydrogenase [Clostridia bacterium]|nr:3-phosphoglycerate dehydrogenase [Clostridia bacterium]